MRGLCSNRLSPSCQPTVNAAICEVRLIDQGTDQVRAFEIGAAYRRAGEDCAFHAGSGKIGAGKIGASHIAAAQIGLCQIRSNQDSAREISIAQVGVHEEAPGKSGPFEFCLDHLRLVHRHVGFALGIANISAQVAISMPSRRSTRDRSVRTRMASRMATPRISASARIASLRSAWVRSAPNRFAPRRLVRISQLSRRDAPLRSASASWQPVRSKPERSRNFSDARRPPGRRARNA